MIPMYTPQGYVFESLKIESLESKDIMSKYLFYNEEKKEIEVDVFVSQNSEMALEIEGGYRTIKSIKGNVYIQEESGKIATIQLDSGTTVKIWGQCSDEEIIKMIENISD